MSTIERTLIILKPEVLERKITGKILKYFDDMGLTAVKIQLRRPPPYMFKEHYSEVIKRVGADIGRDIVARMTRGDCIVCVYEGPNAISRARYVIGSTDPMEASPGTIRGDYAISLQFNVVHGSSDSIEAEREIKLWFPELAVKTVPDVDVCGQGC
jgi:nucleoside-diphosphate kinase